MMMWWNRYSLVLLFLAAKAAGAESLLGRRRQELRSRRKTSFEAISQVYHNEANPKESINVSPPTSLTNQIHTADLVSYRPTSEEVLLSKGWKQSVHRCLRQCYISCPGQAYSETVDSTTSSSSSSSSSSLFMPNVFTGNTILASTVTRIPALLKRYPDRSRSKTTTTMPPSTTQHESSTCTTLEEETTSTISELEAEPSPTILSGIVQPLIPQTVWDALTGKEFYFPSVISNLVRTSLKLASTSLNSNDNIVQWKAADSTTKSILDHVQEGQQEQVTEALVSKGHVMVWLGKFTKEGYGSHLPLVKTVSVLPLSPRDMASLLMDSKRVQSYNKMSLGRSDVVVFQTGVDTTSEEGGFALNGEAKIVRNVTKPPLSKKLMDFVTFMYARRLTESDPVGSGMLGAISSHNEEEEDGCSSYIVVSRAVSGGKWAKGNALANARGGGSAKDTEQDEEEMIRSEILLGVNVLRCVPGNPDMTEVTAITHVNSPSVPTMLAGKVGVKGAVDFVRDIRALYQ